MSNGNDSHPKVLAFALVVVAVTSAFILYMNWKLTNILAAPDWCARAISAEKLAKARDQTSCGELLLKQVGSLAINNHIYAGVIALCLLALMVIVVAAGNISFSVSKSGASANIGKTKVDQVVDQVVGGAKEEGERIKATGQITPPPGEDG